MELKQINFLHGDIHIFRNHIYLIPSLKQTYSFLQEKPHIYTNYKVAKLMVLF